ncbi:MAG: hypothetical protein IPG81_33065 [Sandaracinaceae bacterium]|nr:hypothetical protein [Sandaracinaceae bacterium]
MVVSAWVALDVEVGLAQGSAARVEPPAGNTALVLPASSERDLAEARVDPRAGPGARR